MMTDYNIMIDYMSIIDKLMTDHKIIIDYIIITTTY